MNTKVHAMQTIANTGSKPMTKATIPAEGLDARMMATNLVAEVLAHTMMDSKIWQSFALRLVRGTTDFRAAFVKGMKEQRAELVKQNANAFGNLDKDGNPDPTKSQTKMAGVLVNSATNYISKLNSIATAFNGAATQNGLISHFAEPRGIKPETVVLEQIGFTIVAEYAQKFSASNAGPKAKPFLVKLDKWMETIGKESAENGSAVDQKQYAQVLELLTKLHG